MSVALCAGLAPLSSAVAGDAGCAGPVVASAAVAAAASGTAGTGGARVELALGNGAAVRLAGVLVPSGSPAAARADLDAALAVYAGREIRVHAADPALDRRGRNVGQIEVDGRWAQAELLADGLVVFDGTGGPCGTALAEAEERARSARKGLWAVLSPMPAVDAAALAALPDFVIVEATVFSVGNSGPTTYLNFGWDFSSDLTVSIAGRILAGFPPEKSVAGLAGKTVRVRGWADERAGAEIRLEDQAALDVIKE